MRVEFSYHDSGELHLQSPGPEFLVGLTAQSSPLRLTEQQNKLLLDRTVNTWEPPTCHRWWSWSPSPSSPSCPAGNPEDEFISSSSEQPELELTRHISMRKTPSSVFSVTLSSSWLSLSTTPWSLTFSSEILISCTLHTAQTDPRPSIPPSHLDLINSGHQSTLFSFLCHTDSPLYQNLEVRKITGQ